MTNDINSNVDNSVIMGDLNQVTNVTNDSRIQCPSCFATGNITILYCEKPSCRNAFCEHCQDPNDKRKCRICIDEMKQQRVQQLEAARQVWAQEEQRRLEQDRILFNSMSATLFRWRILIIPLLLVMLICSSFALFEQLSQDMDYGLGFVMSITILTILMEAFLPVSERGNARHGKAKGYAYISILSPLIGWTITVILMLIIGPSFLCLSSLIITILYLLISGWITDKVHIER